MRTTAATMWHESKVGATASSLAVLAMMGLAGSAAPARAERVMVLDGQIGPALLLQSRSKAIGHGVKPSAQLGLRTQLAARLEIGGAIWGLLDASQHYRVLGGLAVARFAVWQGPVFSAGAALGLGAGYNADILHADLDAEAPIAPYGTLAVDARWWIGQRWAIGVEASWANLSIVRIAAVVGIRFGAG